MMSLQIGCLSIYVVFLWMSRSPSNVLIKSMCLTKYSLNVLLWSCSRSPIKDTSGVSLYGLGTDARPPSSRPSRVHTSELILALSDFCQIHHLSFNNTKYQPVTLFSFAVKLDVLTRRSLLQPPSSGRLVNCIFWQSTSFSFTFEFQTKIK